MTMASKTSVQTPCEADDPGRPGPLAYRVRSAAKALDLSEREVWRLLERRELAAIRCGRATLILASALTDWLRRKSAEA